MDSRTGTAIGISTSAICFWLVAPWFLEIKYFASSAIFLFIGIGLIRPALSANLGTAGIRFLGPTLSGTLSSTSPFFGVALGALWLGEEVTGPIVAGTTGIFCAVILLARRGGNVFRDWPVWALALPIGAAVIRALGHAVNKFGMGYIPDPYFATLLGFTTSALVTVFVQSMYGNKNITRNTSGWNNLQGAGIAWFMAGGMMYAVAVLSLNQALIIGEVVTVVPIVSCNPIFTMLLSIFIFRSEKIKIPTILALALVLPSVLVVVLWG